MRKSLVCMALLAGIAGTVSARAQTIEGIPLPPPIEPPYELGVRYWQSVGKTKFSDNASERNRTLGNPTSVLTYDDMSGYTAEFFWYARNESEIFAKGFAGGGWLDGGSLDDEDYARGQIKFSDTFSKIEGSSIAYTTIDLGRRFVVRDSGPFVSVSPFVGFNYWYEQAMAHGVRCNPDDVPPSESFCPFTGRVVIPYSQKVIRNEANWASIRLGAEIKVKLWDRLTLIADAAGVPYAYVSNFDSHYLRGDLGPVPNIEDRGSGWGYQLEGALRYDISPEWSAGAGVRYWFATVGGVSDFRNFDIAVPLKDFTSERFGVFGDLSYRF